MEERKGNRKHSREFKEEAVRLVVEGGRRAVEVAQGSWDPREHAAQVDQAA